MTRSFIFIYMYNKKDIYNKIQQKTIIIMLRCVGIIILFVNSIGFDLIFIDVYIKK